MDRILISFVNRLTFSLKVSASGKGVLITGCEAPIAWYLAKKLDDLGFTVYAGFNVPIEDCEEAKILKEETSGRMKTIYVDVESEKTVSTDSLLQF